MAMTPEVQEQYDRVLTTVTVRNGTLVSINPSIYGWEAFPWSDPTREHWDRCGMKPLTGEERAVEDSWDEFQGTFYEGDTTVHGVTVYGLSCNCGQLTDRSIRWRANMREVAEVVFTEAFGKKG